MRAASSSLSLAVGALLGTFAVPLESDAAPVQYHCSFGTVADRDGVRAQVFAFDIIYDAGTQTAAVVGNNGVSPMQVYAGPDAVSFIEFVSTGVVQTITMKPDGEAVHSRHTLIGTEFVASQNYGSCLP